MSYPGGNDPFDVSRYDTAAYTSEPPIQAEVVYERPSRMRVLLPLLLFLATCWTTTALGGFAYSVPLLTILLCHEFGHYFQARRYHVPASLPYFIPMPFGPLGTMGAVIGMRGNSWDRKALFDIGISGPLAGLVPTLLFCVLGLQQSQIIMGRDTIGDPLLIRLLARWLLGPLGPGEVVAIHPFGYAGWVGVFITALNLLPIGQLDGGHILYALLRRKAHVVASAILMLAIAAMIFTKTYQWLPMVVLLLLIGPYHPPTTNDNAPLGAARVILGWATLAFVIIGFTPRPFL